MRYGITSRNGHVVLVLPDGGAYEMVPLKLKAKAKVRQLTPEESGIVNKFMGELVKMTDPKHVRSEYRNAVLERGDG